MKKSLSFFILLISFNAFAQCSYDESCTISPAFPNLCPLQLPDATVGEFYSSDITFWMPVQFQAEGFDVNLDQVVVTDISGLPLGLSIELSNPSMTFNPSDSEFGCANLSGSPLVAGDYVITVSIVANVTVVGVGFEVAQPETFDLFITVNPGEGGNASFTYSPSFGCEDLNVSFDALISSDEYNVEYIWDFGNGVTSNQQNPPSQLYDNSGLYNINLTTNLTTEIYTLKDFNINYTNVDCWGYDVEEACVDLFGAVNCWGDPDLLIKLYDGNGNLIYQTDYTTSTTASWSNINLNLNNPPYTVSVWDTEEWDDLGGLQLSDNDELATFSLNLEDGMHNFNSSCSSGNYTIVSEVITIQSIQDSEVVNVFEVPEMPTEFNDELYVVYLAYQDAISYQWFIDGVIIEGANEASYVVIESGTYHCEFITIDGCQGFSYPLDVVKCDSNFSPSIFVSDITLLTTDSEYNLEWYWNGIFYGSGTDITTTTDGLYWVIASDDYGCNWSSDTIFYQSPIIDDIDNDGIDNNSDDDVDGDGIINSEDDDVDGDGIPNDIDNDIDGDGISNGDDDTISGYLFITDFLPEVFNIFPNPSTGILNMTILDNYFNNKLAHVLIKDLNGSLVFSKEMTLSKDISIDVTSLPAAAYLIEISTGSSIFIKHLIISN